MPWFIVKRYDEVTSQDLIDTAALFSAHYGVWGARGPRPGQRVSFTPDRLRDACLFDDKCGVVLCREGPGGALLGHALFRTFNVNSTLLGKEPRGPGVWITQLVVHEAARGKRLASSMLLQLCTRDVVVMGLLSSHPHALRALERACARPIVQALVCEAAPALACDAGVPYFRAEDILTEGGRCVANTRFFVDHAEVDALLAAGTYGLGP